MNILGSFIYIFSFLRISGFSAIFYFFADRIFIDVFFTVRLIRNESFVDEQIQKRCSYKTDIQLYIFYYKKVKN